MQICVNCNKGVPGYPHSHGERCPRPKYVGEPDSDAMPVPPGPSRMTDEELEAWDTAPETEDSVDRADRYYSELLGF